MPLTPKEAYGLHLLTSLESDRVTSAPARPTVWRGGGGRTFSLIYDTRRPGCVAAGRDA